MVALPDGAEVLGAAAFAEGLQDGGDGGGALGGQVAADPPGAVQGGVEEEVPVAEASPAGVLVGVGLLGAPGLVGGLGDELEVVEAGAGGGGLDEDLVRLGLEVVVVDPAGPGGDLPRPRDRQAAGGRRVVERGWRASSRIWRTAAFASLRPRRFLAASQAELLAYPSASCP